MPSDNPENSGNAGRSRKRKSVPPPRRKPAADPDEHNGLTRPALHRMLYIHEVLRRGDYPSSNALAQALDVSNKTIRRDIDLMRDRLRLPIDYEPSRHGFFYTREVAKFPSFQISEGELIALCVAQLALTPYHGTPFEAPLRSAFRKLAEMLPDEISLKLDELDGAISFHGAESIATVDLAVFETLSAALLAHEEIEFVYHKLETSSGDGELRRGRPLHLTCPGRGWYLFTYDLDREAVRTFALVRIESVRRTGRHFELDEPFEPKSRLAHSIGIHSGGEVADVRIRFSGVAARLVRERLCHPSQRTRLMEDGTVELTMRVAINPELIRWALSWGADAQVLEPESLRERIRDAAENILRNMAAQTKAL